MKKTWLPAAFAIVTVISACQQNSSALEKDSSEATVASETGTAVLIPADVLAVTRPLINGGLYERPDFESSPLARFDTSQPIHLLDTSGAVFVKARIRKDTATLTGYIPRAILPEERQGRR